MARAFINFPAMRAAFLQTLEGIPEYNFERDFKPFEDSDLFRAAARLVRLHAQGHQSIVQKVSQAFGQHTKLRGSWTPTVLMAPGSTPETVRVYPNIPLDTFSLSQAREVSPYYYPREILGTLFDRMQEQLNNPATAKGWTPFRRGWSRLKRHEELTWDRALVRFFKHPEGIKHNILRDAQEILLDFFKPMELTYADAPADFITMYSTGPKSCMTVGDDSSPAQTLLSHDHWATSWYAYHPYIRGVYITKGGIVQARTLLYDTGLKIRPWRWGRVYSLNGGIHDLFVDMLRAAGYTNLSDPFDRACSFSIPGIPHGVDFICPTPYFDNIAKNSVTCRFDTNTKVFHFECGEGGEGNYDGGTCRYVLGSNYHRKACAHCGEMHRPTEGYIHGDDSYCSESCVLRAGLVIAGRTNGGTIIMRREGAYQDPVSDTYFFEHIHAARTHGREWRPYGLLTVLEEPQYTIYGIRVHTSAPVLGNSAEAHVSIGPIDRIQTYSALHRVGLLNNSYLSDGTWYTRGTSGLPASIGARCITTSSVTAMDYNPDYNPLAGLQYPPVHPDWTPVVTNPFHGCYGTWVDSTPTGLFHRADESAALRTAA